MPKKTGNTKVPTQNVTRKISRGYLLASLVLGIFLLVSGWWAFSANTPGPASSLHSAPSPALPLTPRIASLEPSHNVDEQACQGCHAAQAKAWQGSHHQLAMEAAEEPAVLGNFADQTFQGEKELTRFFRKGSEFWVNTPGPDGQPADFKVAYTFGIAPLQQYLIEVPGGRLQALGVAWDTEKHQWFALYPGQGVDFKNPLHWSKPAQNANFMCVECHTTGFKRNFDAASNTFNSHWNSLGVGCQACHGPASGHLAWAAKPSQVEHFGFDVDIKSKDATVEIETCARCHGRRAPLGDGFEARKRLMDDYLPSTLTRELYALDGKIQDEVFEHGAFEQSKMFQKGVRCSNCHEPHSTSLRAPGNGVCLQCHNTAGKTPYPEVDGRGLIAKDYNAPEHTHHPAGQPGSQCVDCHMPGKLYMINDYRHDHGFTLPNPPRAERLGTPDACLACHQNDSGAKVAELFRYWYGPDKEQPARYDEGMALIRGGQPGAEAALLTLLRQNNLPAIRRATLLAELPAYPGAATLKLATRDLLSPEPQVRESAVHAVSALLSPAQRIEPLAPLLADPIVAVRLAAARELLTNDPSSLGAAEADWRTAIGEYETVQHNLAERAEANLNLATLYQATGRPAEVEPALRTALLRDADFLPAAVMLSQRLEATGRGSEATTLLNAQIKAHPESALLQHSLGLALIRQAQPKQALTALEQAVTLEPQNAQYAFVLAVALHDQGQIEPAIQVIERQLKLQPQNRTLRLTLIQFYQVVGRQVEAQQLLKELQAINPDDPVLIRSE